MPDREVAKGVRRTLVEATFIGWRREIAGIDGAVPSGRKGRNGQVQ
jgi:hypothetical protein